MALPEDVSTCIGDLKCNKPDDHAVWMPATDISWLYVPSHEYRSHRVCYQSALTPYAGNRPGCGCAALEIISGRFDVDGLDKRANILPEELGYQNTLDSEFTEYAYVIHDLNIRENLTCIHEYFEGVPGFELLGRWGRWNYNNMDVCILDAMKLIEDMLK